MFPLGLFSCHGGHTISGRGVCRLQTVCLLLYIMYANSTAHYQHGKGSARHTISTANSTAGVSSSSGTANSTATATDQRRARLGLGLFAAVPSWGTGWGIMPSPAPARAQARRGSVAAVSSLSMALRDDLGRNVKFGRIGKSATYTFLTYLDGQGALDTYQGKSRN